MDHDESSHRPTSTQEPQPPVHSPAPLGSQRTIGMPQTSGSSAQEPQPPVHSPAPLGSQRTTGMPQTSGSSAQEPHPPRHSPDSFRSQQPVVEVQRTSGLTQNAGPSSMPEPQHLLTYPFHPNPAVPPGSQRTSGQAPSTGPGASYNWDERQPLVDHSSPHTSSPVEPRPARPQSIYVPVNQPLPPLPPVHQSPTHYRAEGRGQGGYLGRSRSYIDHNVPVVVEGPNTLGNRLEATLKKANEEREKYEQKAKITGWALNVAIGLQVLLGALTTGLSAVTTGRQTSIMTSILGGLTTLVASYLARARGSNEPELSITRVKDLEQFIRECEAFKTDFGHLVVEPNTEHDLKLNDLRKRFEELLGNANGERRLAPPISLIGGQKEKADAKV